MEMELARLVFMSMANVWPGSFDPATLVLFLVEFITVARGKDEGDILYVPILHVHMCN